MNKAPSAPTKVELFESRADLSRFLVEVATLERGMRFLVAGTVDRLDDGSKGIAAAEMARTLFNEHCDAARAGVSARELAAVDADIAALLPRLRPLIDEGLVVDLATFERLMETAE